MQLLDPHDKPCGRVISWLDRRGQPFDAELTAELGRSSSPNISATAPAASPSARSFVSGNKLPNARAAQPIGFVGDVIVGRLCGRRAHDATSLGIAMLYNPWLGRPDPEVLARLGLATNNCPACCPRPTAAGALQQRPRKPIGLPPGIPVSPAIHDQYAASLGAASVEEGDVNFGAGTAWVLLANTGQPGAAGRQRSLRLPHPSAALRPDAFHEERRLGHPLGDVLLGDAAATTEQIDMMLEAVPPGSDGLRFWPLLSGGPEIDGFGREGGRLAGITLAHSRNHLVRAVVEGLACELLRHIRLLTDAGLPVSRLVMCGSAAAGRTRRRSLPT